ncbi:MAG: hypothetical protein HYY76_16365 [Acidobacteria bacterium]|nr:hypothetical protein [Acidobacteriota bacterium]
MQLRAARLCVNCEEIHDAHACPACGSENFTYLTRWVPASRPQPQREPPRIVLPTLTQRIIFGSGLLGLAAFWFMRWSRRAKARVEASAVRSIGELR